MEQKILDLCRIYDIKFSIEYYNEFEGIRLTATRLYLGTTYLINIAISEEEINNSHSRHIMTKLFCEQVDKELCHITVEQILERADVCHRVNPMTLCREVVSRNKNKPLTIEEKALILRMWEASGVPFEVVFNS